MATYTVPGAFESIEGDGSGDIAYLQRFDEEDEMLTCHKNARNAICALAPRVMGKNLSSFPKTSSDTSDTTKWIAPFYIAEGKYSRLAASPNFNIWVDHGQGKFTVLVRDSADSATLGSATTTTTLARMQTTLTIAGINVQDVLIKVQMNKTGGGGGDHTLYGFEVTEADILEADLPS